MSKILKNYTGLDKVISDTGVTVLALDQYTIQSQDYLLFAASDELVTYIGQGVSGLIVNDGSFDLSISDGVDLIKGIFPQTIQMQAIVNDVSGQDVPEDSVSGVRMTPRQAVHVNLRDNNGNEIGPTNPINTETQFRSTSLDAFGRLRVSDPISIFESTFTVDKQPILWNESLTGSATATHNANKSSVDFATSTASGDKAIFQTYRYLTYHPGKSHLIIMTGNLGGLKANCRRRVGNFDANNGVFFELDGTQPRAVIRSSVSGSPVDTQINQSSWNIDPLDGTGPTGINIDWSKQQLLFVDYQWLGSGSVRFGTIIGGSIIYAHQENHANILSAPWSKAPSLPLRAEIENTGTTASITTAHLTCAALISEGGYGPAGIIRAASNESTPRTLNAIGTTLPVLSLRKKSANVTIPIDIVELGTFANSADDFVIKVIKNGTLTGASWVSLTGVAEKDVSATAITGGQEVYVFYLRGSSTTSSISLIDIFRQALNLSLGSSIAGTSDIISIVAINLTSSASLYGFINYKEFI